LEFFGKDANLIITDETREILDLYRPSGSIFNHPRAVHIGAHYTWPPKTKASPFDETAVADYFTDLKEAPHHVFEGFSKALGESLLAVAQTKDAWFEALEHPRFAILDGRFRHFEGEPSMAFVDWADARLRQIFEETPYNLTLKNLQKTLEKKRAKALKKIGVLTQELGEVSRADDFIQTGQWLMQSPDKHTKKASVTVQDYATGETVTLKLDGKKTVLAHANDAFKKAKKIKQSVPHLKRQIKKANDLADYLESIIDQLHYADANALYAIQDELSAAHIIRPPKRKGKTQKAKPKVYVWEGIHIYVGQNHHQNAELTHRFAKRSWRFLHARGAPGAHVIVASDDPSDDVIEKAAMLAAYHSKLRHSPKAEVDSVFVKDVRTLKGKPGSMVTYDRYETLVVTGDHPDIPIKKSA
jgi:predicted ribosome quality control (RQC) complex YloA/Tae2 family protein